MKKIIGTFSIICILTLTLLELTLWIWGITYQALKPKVTSSFSDDEIRILCLGESTTELGYSYSYPSVLQNELQKKFPHKKFTVINKGVSGTNTALILDALEQNLITHKPHFVITMMGINDVWNKDLPTPIPVYMRLKLYKLIKLIKINWKQNETTKLSPLSLAYHLKEKKQFKEAQTLFLEVLKEEANITERKQIFRVIGEMNLLQGNEAEAKSYFERSLEKNSTAQDYLSITDLILHGVLGDRKFYDRNPYIEGYIKKIIALTPNSPEGYEQLTFLLSKYPNKTIERDKTGALAHKYKSTHPEIYHLLASKELLDNNNLKAISLLEEALSFSKNKTSTFLWYALLTTYNEIGDKENFQRTLKKYEQHLGKTIIKPTWSKGSFYLLKTDASRENYKKIINKITAFGAVPIVMQYPNRSIKMLREILQDTHGIIWVDNEPNFKKALETKKYDDLFSDKFATDFGHFTPEGSLLVAKQIIAALIRSNEILFLSR